MTDRQLKKALELYKVNEPNRKKVDETLEAVSGVTIIRTVPQFNIHQLLKGQLHNVRAPFFITCGVYLAIVLLVSLISNSDSSIVLLCAATPFLSVGAMSVLLQSNQKCVMELEMTCFYQPKTIFAARSVICGGFNLIAVTLCSLICSFTSSAAIRTSLLLGLCCLVLSSVVTLSFCAFFKAQTATLLTIGIFGAFAGLLMGNQGLIIKLLEISAQRLCATLIFAVLMLVAVYFFTVKKYNFERIDKSYGA